MKSVKIIIYNYRISDKLNQIILHFITPSIFFQLFTLGISMMIVLTFVLQICIYILYVACQSVMGRVQM